jgi:hypothetical protein
MTIETNQNETDQPTPLTPAKAVYLTSLLSSKLGQIDGNMRVDEDEYSNLMWVDWVQKRDNEGNPTLRVLLDYSLSAIFIYEVDDVSIDDDLRLWLLGVCKLYGLEVYALDPSDEEREEDDTVEVADTPIPKHLH